MKNEILLSMTEIKEKLLSKLTQGYYKIDGNLYIYTCDDQEIFEFTPEELLDLFGLPITDETVLSEIGIVKRNNLVIPFDAINNKLLKHLNYDCIYYFNNIMDLEYECNTIAEFSCMDICDLLGYRYTEGMKFTDIGIIE